MAVSCPMERGKTEQRREPYEDVVITETKSSADVIHFVY